MNNTRRLLGMLLLAADALLMLAIAALLVSQVTHGETTMPGAILGACLALFVVGAPLAIGGAVLLARGRAEARENATLEREKRVLEMVLSKGKLSFAEAALNLGLTRGDVEEAVRSLVGKAVFSGAVDWSGGVLYSKDAASLDASKRCPNCGGQVEIAGKDLVRCAYCGTDVFRAK